MTADPEATPSVVRLEICPRCGYSLAGLSEIGVCPECGRNYDQQLVVLYGWARGGHATIWNTRSNYLVVLWASICLIQVLPLIVGIGRPRGDPMILRLVNIALFGGPVVATLLLRRRRDDAPPVQVRMAPEGCVQCDTPPTISFRIRVYRAFLLLLAPAFLLLGGIDVALGNRAGWFVISAALILSGFAGASVLWQRRRRQAAHGGDSQLLLDNAQHLFWPAKLTPWTYVKSVKIEAIREGVFHITASAVTGTASVGRGMDVEVECSANEIEHIQSRIAEWRRLASHPHSSSIP